MKREPNTAFECVTSHQHDWNDLIAKWEDKGLSPEVVSAKLRVFEQLGQVQADLIHALTDEFATMVWYERYGRR